MAPGWRGCISPGRSSSCSVAREKMGHKSGVLYVCTATHIRAASSFVRPGAVLPSRPCTVEVHGAQRRSRTAAWPPAGYILYRSEYRATLVQSRARLVQLPNMLRTARGSSSEWIEPAPAQPSDARQSPAPPRAARPNDRISDRKNSLWKRRDHLATPSLWSEGPAHRQN
jgi:hypothetical protein